MRPEKVEVRKIEGFTEVDYSIDFVGEQAGFGSAGRWADTGVLVERSDAGSHGSNLTHFDPDVFCRGLGYNMISHNSSGGPPVMTYGSVTPAGEQPPPHRELLLLPLNHGRRHNHELGIMMESWESGCSLRMIGALLCYIKSPPARRFLI